MRTRRDVLLSLSSAAVLRAQNLIAARMDEAVSFLADRKQFTGSVLAARGAGILFHKAYGFADIEWEIRNTTDTKFRMGSITRQFTAACILLLEERGKLSTAQSIRKYFPDAPPAWEKITIHHLLTNTAGLPNFTDFPDYPLLKLRPSTPEDLYRRIREARLDFEPGEKFAYSNSDYLILGYLIEKASGEAYAKFVQQNLLTALSLNDSGYESRAITPKRAKGYSPGPKGLLNADYVDMSVPYASGSLFSTTGDLLAWQRALYGGRLFSAESLAKMTTPFKNNYAYGLQVATANGHKRISHNGGIFGFNAHLAWYPDETLTIAVLANQSGPAAVQLGARLAAIALG